jgi:LuxR family transcriptional regulator, maltose regulon positive regulatory protein
MSEQELIMTKLIAPVPPSSYMPRAGLNRAFRKGLDTQTMIVHGGAGYGKSSGLARFFADHPVRYSWYTVSSEDDDLLPFLRHLFRSIQLSDPAFDPEAAFGGNEPAPGRAVAGIPGAFVNELMKIREPFAIVIDDFHHVDHVFEIDYFMEKVLEFLPPHIRVVVASRVKPKWSVLPRLKLSGRLSEVGEEVFRFSRDEIEVYFEDYFGRRLDAAVADQILTLTEGWAIAVRLMADQVRDGQEREEPVLKPALADLFSYLSEDVFNWMPPDDQKALLEFSIFPAFSDSLIRAFYGEARAEKLDDLSRRHVFIQPLGSGSYRFHALFQQFLENKWNDIQPGRFEELQKKAARFCAERGETIQALHHAEKSGDPVFFASFLDAYAHEVVEEGKFDWLLDRLKTLPAQVKETWYGLYCHEGECFRYRAFYEKAKQSYLRCAELAEAAGDRVMVSRANAGIAHIYLDTIQPGSAEPFLRKAIVEAENGDGTDQKAMDRLKRQYAENLVNLGKAEEAETWAADARLDAAILSEGNLDVRISLRRGRLDDALGLLEQRTGNTAHLPDSHRETDLLLSFIYSLKGEAERAKETAGKGIRGKQSAFVGAVARMRKGHAEFLEDPYDLRTPERLYLDAIGIMEELNVTRGTAEAYLGLAMLRASEGRFDEALSCAEKGLAETESVDDQWLSAIILVGISVIRARMEDWGQSGDAAEKARSLFIRSGDTFGRMASAFWMAHSAFRSGDEARFFSDIEEFGRLLTEHGYEFFIRRRTLMAPVGMETMRAMIARAASAESPGTAARLAEITGTETGVRYPVHNLFVRLSGPFILYRDGREVPDKEWKRDKSKELLAYLCLNRDRYIPKEELLHALWTDADEKSADRDFKVALNALLKVLEPDRNAREEPFFISRRKTMYRLNPESSLVTDVELFRKYAEAGIRERRAEEAKEKLEKAIYRYGGVLFGEKPATDWIRTERESHARLRLDVMERLAQTCTRLEEYDEVIRWSEKLLEADETREEAYRLLIYANYRLGRRSRAIRWFERCRDVFDRELGIEPMEPTIRMYEMVLEATETNEEFIEET